MSRKVLIANRVDTGVTYGRVVKTTEHMLMQDFAHEHVEMVTRDKLMRNAAAAEVTGFAFTLTTGLGLSIAEGHAIDVLGRSFQTLPPGTPAVAVMPAAHASLPRIDLVYATLVADQDGEPADLPFRRLRTTPELTATPPASPYPPTDFNVLTRRQSVAVIGVRQGTANATPVAPAAGANEVPLYQVRVNAAVTSLVSGNVTDVRRVMKSLADALLRLDTLEALPVIATFAEAVQDVVGPLIGVTADTGLAKNYDDPGNAFTLTGVAASGSAMGMMTAAQVTKLGHLPDMTLGEFDGRFVNGTGDTMTGLLAVDVGTPTLTASGINAIVGRANGGISPNIPVHGVVGIAEVSGTNGGDPGTCIGGHFIGRHLGGPGNQTAVAYGILAEVMQVGSPLSPTWFAVFGNCNGAGGANTYAGYFAGKVHVTGALSAGSKTFIIDHPLDPLHRDVVYNVAEGPAHLLFYPVTVALVAGAASVDLDAAFAHTEETVSLIAADLKVYGVYPPRVVAVINSAAGSSGGQVLTLELTSDDEEDTAQVNVLIVGRRNDAYIRGLAPWTDGNGVHIPEHDKVEATGSGLALVRVHVEEADERAGTAETKVDPVLTGRDGFPHYPAVVFESIEPAETFAYMLEAWTQLGPSLPTIGANVTGVGTRAWTDTSMILGADDSKSKVSIGVLRSATSNYLVGRGYGFTVPEDATVRAVVVEIRRMLHDSWRPFSVVTDNVVALTANNVVRDSVNKAAEGVEWADGFLRVASYYFSGDDLDGLTYEDFNAPEFGVALSASLEFADEEEAPVCTAGVDTIRVTLYYEAAE